jgi:thioredoxin 1
MIFTSENFETEVTQSSVPVLVDVWADGCGPCRLLSPIIDELATANEGKVKVGKLNGFENTDIAVKLNVRSVPTVILFKGGVEQERMMGIKANAKAELQAMIDRFCE